MIISNHPWINFLYRPYDICFEHWMQEQMESYGASEDFGIHLRKQEQLFLKYWRLKGLPLRQLTVCFAELCYGFWEANRLQISAKSLICGGGNLLIYNRLALVLAPFALLESLFQAYLSEQAYQAAMVELHLVLCRYWGVRCFFLISQKC